MPVETYTVQVIVTKVFEVEVNAESTEQAIETAVESPIKDIEAFGKPVKGHTDAGKAWKTATNKGVCENCGQSFANHNDDGSCVED